MKTEVMVSTATRPQQQFNFDGQHWGLSVPETSHLLAIWQCLLFLQALNKQIHKHTHNSIPEKSRYPLEYLIIDQIHRNGDIYRAKA